MYCPSTITMTSPTNRPDGDKPSVLSYLFSKIAVQILDALITQNEHSWDIFQLKSKDMILTSTETEEGYSKYSKVRVQFHGNLNYYDGYICLMGKKVVISTGRKTLEEPFENVIHR